MKDYTSVIKRQTKWSSVNTMKNHSSLEDPGLTSNRLSVCRQNQSSLQIDVFISFLPGYIIEQKHAL